MIDHSQIDQYHSLDGIPAMTSPQVHAYLTQLGRSWTGQGTAMELGCWLGASSVALLRGLAQAGYNMPYWAFDAWNVNKDQIPKAKAQGCHLILGQNSELMFLNNVRPVYSDIISCRGSLPATLTKYDNQPIEFCIFDAPKAEPTFTECIKRLSPHWIPGVTVLGLLDYHFYQRHKGAKRIKFRAPVDYMEKYGRHFEVEKKWDNECAVFFRYLKNF